MERDCESELSKLNIEQNACIYHFGASVIHGQRSNILRLLYERLNESAAVNMELAKAGVPVKGIGITNEELENYFLNLTGGAHNA